MRLVIIMAALLSGCASTGELIDSKKANLCAFNALVYWVSAGTRTDIGSVCEQNELTRKENL